MAWLDPAEGNFSFVESVDFDREIPTVHDDRGRRRNERQQRPLASPGSGEQTRRSQRARRSGRGRKSQKQSRTSAQTLRELRSFSISSEEATERKGRNKGLPHPLPVLADERLLFQSNFPPSAEVNPHFLMIETVKKILGLGKKNTGIKLMVSCERLEKRVALLENNRLEEYTTERDSDRNIVGAIYKGKVRNIEQGIKAMFVDIGFEKNAFLQFWDAIPAALDSGVEAVSREVGKKKGQKITHKDVPKIYPVGSDILVQVKKGPIGNKGPRITTDVSLAGRYLVLMPFNDQCGISRKIDDPKGARAAAEDSSRTRYSRGNGRHHSHRRPGPARTVFRPGPEHSSPAMGGTSRRALRNCRLRFAFFRSPT